MQIRMVRATLIKGKEHCVGEVVDLPDHTATFLVRSKTAVLFNEKVKEIENVSIGSKSGGLASKQDNLRNRRASRR